MAIQSGDVVCRDRTFKAAVAMGLGAMLLILTGCFGASGTNAPASDNGSGSGATTRPASDALRTYPLASIPTSTVTVNNHVIRAWLAQDFDPKRAGGLGRPSVVEEGLMHVSPDEIADDQGMLFVFSDERLRGFWMKNTITPLDIAFARSDGTIVKIWQMPPLTLNTFSSIEPAMFALEVKEGTFARLGAHEGDRLLIPADVFKTYP